ncbi:S-phase kinase-associated protein 2-like [Actinia tenebrosa]|uniref:S-phase kinase-associated protein 2-like n=1 Tax=Actinia tenebrosa TaxID=6105 RepID=A0A6P8I0E8_ACTTE|nr:S-phase kinase-associated protein 2-like [Actinia tenebrosa]
MAPKKQYSRTSDRYKRTRKALKDSRKRRNTLPSGATKYTWGMNESETEEFFNDLDVSVLRWPDEDVRDSSQDQELVEAEDLNGKTTSNNLGQQVSKNNSTKSRILAKKQSKSCGICGHHRQVNHSNAKRKENTEKLDPFTILSDEMILGIFKFLPRHTLSVCAQVSKQWQIFAYDESLWRCVDMAKTKLQPGILGSVLLRGVRVLRLASSMVCSPIFDDNLNIFPDIVPVCQTSDCPLKLCYLDATLCTFEENSLLCLLMHSRRLICLSLDSCTLSLSILRAIGQCQDLRKLNLAMCTGITLQGMKALVNGCKRLTELNLAWTNLGKESILQVVQNLPNLTKLNLSGCRVCLTDEAVLQLVQNCPKLTHLDLSDAIQITALSLSSIAKNLDLQQLAISRCYSILPQAFHLCTQMKSLEKLEVYGILNTDGVDLLKKELPGIKINSCLFSTIARPVSYKYDGTIWGITCEK